MLAFLPCQRASRDCGSHDGGAAGEHLEFAAYGAATQTFSPVVGAGIHRLERAHSRPARIRVPPGTIITRLVQVSAERWRYAAAGAYAGGGRLQRFVRRGLTPRTQGDASPALLFRCDALSAFQPPGIERLVHRSLVRPKEGDCLGIKERYELCQEHAGHALR